MSLDFLVVDSSPAVRRMIHRTLRMGDMQTNRVLEASDAPEALNLLDNHYVDGIIAEWDAWLDQETRLVIWLASDEVMHEIPTITLLTDDRPATIESVTNQNITDLLVKPFQPEELYAKVKQVGPYESA